MAYRVRLVDRWRVRTAGHTRNHYDTEPVLLPSLNAPKYLLSISIRPLPILHPIPNANQSSILIIVHLPIRIICKVYVMGHNVLRVVAR